MHASNGKISEAENGLDASARTYNQTAALRADQGGAGVKGVGASADCEWWKSALSARLDLTCACGLPRAFAYCREGVGVGGKRGENLEERCGQGPGQASEAWRSLAPACAL